ncbi:hypothetical protein BXP70_10840 [Hymenobacter crusticola]|uniref:Uncharacterized protein n=1 Tax=Hymenobacter crusticola TaxID=1770526 RepID=A0A243WGC6_9BACT|nr:hypothetical protein BXP70_10840 [Hymenobacter crusticola]
MFYAPPLTELRQCQISAFGRHFVGTPSGNIDILGGRMMRARELTMPNVVQHFYPVPVGTIDQEGIWSQLDKALNRTIITLLWLKPRMEFASEKAYPLRSGQQSRNLRGYFRYGLL